MRYNFSIIGKWIPVILIAISCQNKNLTDQSQPPLTIDGYTVGSLIDSNFIEEKKDVFPFNAPSPFKDDSIASFFHKKDSNFVCIVAHKQKTILYILWNNLPEKEAIHLISDIEKQAGKKPKVRKDEEYGVIDAYTWKDVHGNNIGVYKRRVFNLKTVINLESIENLYYNKDSTVGYYWQAECINQQFRGKFNKEHLKE